ncbi:MAG: zinc-binding dehydrogenase [Alphaproteobacteria bacterium]|nr:zinc-binding dehydrogenase [Alphaproteobacteria bacterium]
MSTVENVDAKAIFLKSYPKGEPQPAHFETRSIPRPTLNDGEVLLRTVWMSVDPYMRGRMRPDVKSYIPPFSLDEPLDGGAVSEVIDSKSEKFAAGDYVVGFAGGWKSLHKASADAMTKVDPTVAPLSAYLGVLGMPGLTAWAGLTQICQPKEGETLFVSGAAGAVGSLVCQLGKKRGLRVVGSAGSAEKCAWLEAEGGCDVAINYKEHRGSAALTRALAAAAPKGVDCYFENVGGDHLEAALNCIGFGGRIALCGMISVYNATDPQPGPPNLTNMIGRGVLAKGFIVSNYMHLTPDFIAEVAPALAAGQIKFRESVYDGLENAPDAFAGLFRGDNFGKAVVRIGPDRL